MRAGWAPAGESQGPFQLPRLIKITVFRIQPCLDAFLQRCKRLLYSSANTILYSSANTYHTAVHKGHIESSGSGVHRVSVVAALTSTFWSCSTADERGAGISNCTPSCIPPIEGTPPGSAPGDGQSTCCTHQHGSATRKWEQTANTNGSKVDGSREEISSRKSAAWCWEQGGRQQAGDQQQLQCTGLEETACSLLACTSSWTAFSMSSFSSAAEASDTVFCNSYTCM